MNVCVFDKNHKMKKSLLSHYIKCHEDDYKASKENGWFCCNNPLNIFANIEQKERHDKNCEFCQKGKDLLYKEDISKIGHEIIEKKLPEDKKEIDFPILDFDEYIKKFNDYNYLKQKDIQYFLNEEKNILY